MTSSLDHDESKQLAVVSRIGADPVHLAPCCDDGIQRNPRMTRRLRVVGHIEAGRKISFDQQLDHSATSRIASPQPNTLREPSARDIQGNRMS